MKTNEEIVQALRYCECKIGCSDCAYHDDAMGCHALYSDAADIIDNLSATNRELEAKLETVKIDIANYILSELIGWSFPEDGCGCSCVYISTIADIINEIIGKKKDG